MADPSNTPIDDPISLAAMSARGGAWMIGSTVVQTVVGFGAMIVLARFIAPSDFGIYAMAAAMLGFVATFRDFGLAAAVVQLKSLDDDTANAVFWHNAKLTAGLAIAMVAVSPAMQRFFGQPQLGPIWLSLTGGILISNLTLPLSGILRREMSFRAIALIEASAIVLGAAAAIIAAVQRQGLWSLVLQQFVVYAVQAGGTIIATPWMPSVKRIRVNAMKWRAFGRELTWTRIIAYVGETLDQFVVGRAFGAAPLGFYQKAEQWAALPFAQLLSPLTNVVQSSFTRVQDDPRRYARFARHLMLGIFAITLPATSFAIVDARELILTLLGPAWIEATAIFRVLVVAGLCGIPLAVSRWIFLAEGRTRDGLKWTAFVTTPVMIVGVLSGIRGGPLAIASGYATALAILALPTIAWCVRRSRLTMADVFSPGLSPLFATSSATLVFLFIPRFADRPTISVTIDAILFGVLLLLAWMVLPRTRRDGTALIATLQHLRR